MRIRTAFIIANGQKKESARLSEEILSYLDELSIKGSVISTKTGNDDIIVPADTDLVITLGGDGTVLYAARAVNEMGVPILPVNLGTFGYITEIGKDEWKEALSYFMENGSNISRRLMLRVTVHRAGKRVWTASALNEAVISSAGIAKVISLSLSLDKTTAGSFRADGMIIATPTGSTGYSLAAGGPILDVDMSAVIITPVCPFTLSNRPLVTSGKVVTLTVNKGQRTDLLLTVDGQLFFPLEEDDTITVEKSRSKALLVRSLRRNFTEVIRDKLHWSGEMHA
ncbi:MAG: NAD(+)/NADH kinase [Spirochaetes bacterium]|uniref:NAD kinase n=1 Tax=Candidatus Ornithospirochaeta stercoripullorum TaxID=2840899 RepID=A0A9D9H2S0_9SPIO|nr:NAD(+)/NADH kinase [Candidatus Ornithospirochaeta stercoripullorum]